MPACNWNNCVRELACGMAQGDTLPEIAARIGLTPAAARDIIFEAHRAGIWACVVWAASLRRTGKHSIPYPQSQHMQEVAGNGRKQGDAQTGLLQPRK